MHVHTYRGPELEIISMECHLDKKVKSNIYTLVPKVFHQSSWNLKCCWVVVPRALRDKLAGVSESDYVDYFN